MLVILLALMEFYHFMDFIRFIYFLAGLWIFGILKYSTVLLLALAALSLYKNLNVGSNQVKSVACIKVPNSISELIQYNF